MRLIKEWRPCVEQFRVGSKRNVFWRTPTCSARRGDLVSWRSGCGAPCSRCWAVMPTAAWRRLNAAIDAMRLIWIPWKSRSGPLVRPGWGREILPAGRKCAFAGLTSAGTFAEFTHAVISTTTPLVSRAHRTLLAVRSTRRNTTTSLMAGHRLVMSARQNTAPSAPGCNPGHHSIRPLGVGCPAPWPAISMPAGAVGFQLAPWACR